MKRKKVHVYIHVYFKVVYTYQTLECDVGPGQILAFATGALNVPPMGFPIPPNIRFITGDDPRALPTASTCSLTLALPLSLTEYNNFKERMTMAVLNTVGFGQL